MAFNRRDFLKITALTAAVVGLNAVAVNELIRKRVLSRISNYHYMMGTIVNFVIITEEAEESQVALNQATGEMKRLIRIFDHHDPFGPLGQLNTTGLLHQPPLELVSEIKIAAEFGALTEGVFDITVKPVLDALKKGKPVTPELLNLVDYRQIVASKTEISLAKMGMAVTLDGIAKGSVIDSGVKKLRELGFVQVLVEAGGDLLASGGGEVHPWKIGVVHPRRKNENLAQLTIQNQAVATSGDYMNYFTSDYSHNHIIDPHTGQSPSQIASATVIAPSVREADALSTTLMILDVRDGLALIENKPDCAAMLVTKDLNIYRSTRFPIT